MRLYIPDNGNRITLLKPWSFTLYNEYRNRGLIDSLDLINSPATVAQVLFNEHVNQRDWTWDVTVDAGTTMTVSRVYIRNGQKDYSSLTFIIVGSKQFKKVKGKQLRFWAKLHDVNTMEIVEPVIEELKDGIPS